MFKLACLLYKGFKCLFRLHSCRVHGMMAVENSDAFVLDEHDYVKLWEHLKLNEWRDLFNCLITETSEPAAHILETLNSILKVINTF